MARTTIDGQITGLWISTDLVTPAWKEVVCAEDTTLDGSADVNTRNTKCAVLKSRGPVSWTLSGTAVANATPTALTEISIDEVFTLFQDGTTVLWKLAHTTAATYYRQGQGFFTAHSESAPAGDLVTFDFTLEDDG